MKKVFSTLLMVFIFAAWAQGTKGYFEQDARKSSNLLVYESTVENGREDGSDFYVADVLRKAVITDLQIYSNYQIIDFYDNDTHKKITAKNPEIKTPAEAAAAVNAKYAVSIKTIIDRTQPPESYKIELSLHLIQEDQVINGYTSSIPWTRDEYLEYAHSEAVFNLLPQIDITLTPLGERLLLNTKAPEMSLEDAKQEEDDINLQLNRTSRKENSVNAQKKVKAQLAQAKERVRKLTKKLQQDEDEKLADQKRSDETKQWISETLSKTQKYTAEINSKKSPSLSIENQINIIESRKQILRDNKNFVAEKIEANNRRLEQIKLQEQEERRNKAPEAGEVDAFGNLNETARTIMQKDVIAIDRKYEEAKIKYAKETEEYYLTVQDITASQISGGIKDLESQEFEADSIKDEDFIFHVDYFDGDRQSWIYTAQFNFGDETIYTEEGSLTYKEITSSKAPSSSELVVAKTREKYNSTVDKYNALFRSTTPYLNAHAFYRISSADYTKPSVYTVTLEKIEIENLATGKIIKTVTPSKKHSFEYFPATDVDWRTTAMKTSEKEELDSKRAAQKSRMERIDRQSKRITWGALFLIPSTWNYYKTESESYQTLGYTLSLGFTNYTYIAGTAEAGDLSALIDLKDNFVDAIRDFDWKYTLAGQLGFTYKLTDWMRLNAFGEVGKINKETSYGFGASADIFIKKLGILAGYTKDYNSKDKWIDKFTVGFEFVF